MHVFILALSVVLHSTAAGFTPEQLWSSWPDERFVKTPAPCIRPAELAAELERLRELHPGQIRLQEAGRSFQGRPVHLVTIGRGSSTVLLWSQMHGDEPSATPALLDIAHFLLSRAAEPGAAAILEELTLVMIPMLNPDGAEIYERRNFQGIDINRDALNLATPGGRVLKSVRDRYEPILGFNLHDQDRRMTVGDTGVLATNAVLAVAGDEAETLTPGRLRAKRACAAIVEALAQFAPGGMARFDEDWNALAFGDNMTAWGTPVVLIESGGPPPERDLEDLTRLNFVAILKVLQELARDDLQGYDTRVYDDLPRNRRNGWADVVVRGGFIRQPGFDPPYRADLAFNLEANDRMVAGCADGRVIRSRIVELGDARSLGGGRIVDASRSLLVAPFVAGVEGWSARRWLRPEVLSDLTRLGVGTVIWLVPRRKVEAAESLAGGMAGEGRAQIEVVSAPAAMPWLTLEGRPLQPASDSLADVLKALTGKAAVSSQRLDLLSATPNRPAERPVFRRGRPASFLVLSPSTEGRIDPDSTCLSAVFINGAEVPGGLQ